MVRVGEDIFTVRLVRGGHSITFKVRWAHRVHSMAFKVRWAHKVHSIAFKVRWAHGDIQWLLTSHPRAHGFPLLFVNFSRDGDLGSPSLALRTLGERLLLLPPWH